jgi:adenylylsulfate kinase-like enzyme
MRKIIIAKNILLEYGPSWVLFRLLYNMKLIFLRLIPITERFYERKVSIQQVDIFRLDVQAIRAFLINLPESDKQKIIETADKALSGKIKAFSSIELDYGNPINWQLNPSTHKSTSACNKWYQIPDFDPDRGDIKYIWEISRFMHFYYFSRAYLITGDRKYYNGFSSQLSDWLDKNPYSYGANYKCGQECTLRAISVLMNYSVFKSLGITQKFDEKNVAILVQNSYKKVISNFFYANRCIKNNHTLSEICGMIIGAWCSKDSKILCKAYNLFEKTLKQQFTSDGGYCQYSYNYQRFAMQIAECVLKISLTSGYTISNEGKKRLLASTILLYQNQSEKGELPNYGSNDGSLIFPLTSCDYKDFRPCINTLHAMLTGFRLYKSGIYDEELAWMDVNSKAPIKHIQRISSKFPEAGVFTLRKGNAFLSIYLNSYKNRPAHMDQLHMDLWIGDENVFCDSGTYSYASELGQKLVSTQGHNTLKLDGKEQMSTLGHFLVYNRSQRIQIFCDENNFEGTMCSKNEYSHERRITWNANVIEILDTIDLNCKWQVLLHTPCYIREKGKAILELGMNGQPLCDIEHYGNYEVRRVERSLCYADKEEINCLVFNQNGESESKIKVIILE